VVLATGSAEAAVHLGFREEVALETLAAWVERQDAKAILGALHRVRVEPGDAILVPAGIPHTIGEGVFVVELQQPSDLSVMLEWRDFGRDGAR
jgi:mannose-6-phosphate isomerase